MPVDYNLEECYRDLYDIGHESIPSGQRDAHTRKEAVLTLQVLK
jgi:hypothetical protein